jgi:serine/threonine-protein kinase RsbW
VIRYAFDAGTPHEIGIAVEVGDEILTLRITDDGCAFDPTQEPERVVPASLDEAPIGGLGLELVRKRAHSLRYERADGRNRLEVTIGRADAASTSNAG